MPVRIRPFLLLAICILIAAPFVSGQIHGVPASVSSFGFGGNFSSSPGVAASVTSLGPNGFGNSPRVFGNCCAGNFHFGGHSGGFSGRHHGQRAVVFPVPSYIPYTQVIVVQPEAVAYEDETEGDAPLILASRSARSRRERVRIVEKEPEPEPVPALAAPPEAAVIPQPSTVLVFKDGHQSEIQNYAIVGDTLFDLADNRARKILLADLDLPATHKANSDRGVDFQLPVAAR